MTTKFERLTRKFTKTTQKSMWITLWKLGISLKKVKNQSLFTNNCRETKMVAYLQKYSTGQLCYVKYNLGIRTKQNENKILS